MEDRFDPDMALASVGKFIGVLLSLRSILKLFALVLLKFELLLAFGLGVLSALSAPSPSEEVMAAMVLVLPQVAVPLRLTAAGRPSTMPTPTPGGGGKVVDGGAAVATPAPESAALPAVEPIAPPEAAAADADAAAMVLLAG